MNEMKTLFKVLEPIILEPLIREVLKFESPAAYAYFMKYSDTHKTYQALEVFVIGTALEMIQLYLNNSTHGTVEGFFEFFPSPTYQLIFQLVFNYGLAIIVQKIGDRNNDYKIHSAGRYCFMEMFYGFNHPVYQDIDYRDLSNKACYPKEILYIRNKNLTFTITNTKVSTKTKVSTQTKYYVFEA